MRRFGGRQFLGQSRVLDTGAYLVSPELVRILVGLFDEDRVLEVRQPVPETASVPQAFIVALPSSSETSVAFFGMKSKPNPANEPPRAWNMAG